MSAIAVERRSHGASPRPSHLDERDRGEVGVHCGLEGARGAVALQVEPDIRAVAELAEPDRHGGRDRLLHVENVDRVWREIPIRWAISVLGTASA